MKKGSTIILRGVLILIAIVVLALSAWALPIGIFSDKTGYYRPILLGLYVPAVPFFVALLQSWKILNFIDKDTPFSDLSVAALRTIKYCAIIISALFASGMPYIFYVADLDDAPGVAAVGFLVVFASFVIATFAGVLQRLIQTAMEIKTENDLTV
jgi:MFS family permease